MAEPTTALTDFALAALAVVLAFRLGRSSKPLPLARKLWVAAFLLIAAGAVLGGVRHALAEETASLVRGRLWAITYCVLGLANLALLAGLVRAFVPAAFRTAAWVALSLRYAAFVVLLLPLRDLRLVVADFALTLILLLAFSVHSMAFTREGAGPWLLATVLVSAAGALVQFLAVRPLIGFNHNDLFHIVQMGATWLFYRAGRRLRDR